MREGLKMMARLAGAGALAVGVPLLRRRMQEQRRHASESEAGYSAAGRKILVIGAGFGGLNATLELDRLLSGEPGSSVLLIDRDSNLFFTPLLWTVSDGRSNPNSVVVPIRTFQRGRKFHLLHAEVQEIDLANKRVRTSAGERQYDKLVIDVGSVTRVPNLPGVRERAFMFRTPGEALALRNRLIEAVEQAHQTNDAALRQEWLTFVVSGGGDTGIELAATIHDYLHHGLLAAYPWLADAPIRVVVVGRAERLVPMSTPVTSAAVRRVLEAQGIEVLTGTAVSGATENAVLTSTVTIPARTLFWAAGITAPALVQQLPVKHADNGAAIVDEYLRLPDYPDVYVVGDSAWAFDAVTHDPLPPTAQAAEHEGRYVGRAIAAILAGRAVKTFQFKTLGHLALLGSHTGVGQVGPLLVTGLPAWFLWHGYYWSHIPAWRNRTHLLTDWLLAAIFGRETTQLPLEPGI